jgi:hypothetical protein
MGEVSMLLTEEDIALLILNPFLNLHPMAVTTHLPEFPPLDG